MWTNSYVDPNNGVTMNPDYLGCKFPGFKDVPIGSITPIIVEPHDMFGPFGAKGLGEPAHGSSGPAICTAIYNAIGVWVKQQPATPDQVLAALGAVL
jgi:CO/xanthine dehydrogenase Mo-binding subunit